MKTSTQQFLEDFNKAFAKSDTSFILENVTTTIRWNVVGDFSAEGKEAYEKALEQMEQDEPMELTIHNIITHGKSAAVNGEMKAGGGKTYAFCDIYKLSGFKNPKVSEITSYALELDSDR